MDSGGGERIPESFYGYIEHEKPALERETS